MPRIRSLWRHRDFMLLWTGQSINMTGTEISYIAMPLLALSLLDASPFEVSLLSAAGYAPFLLAALPVGAFVDRHRRWPLLVSCAVFQGLVLATVPLAAAGGVLTLQQMFIVAFVVATFAVIFDAAHQSYLPSLVGKDQLVDANGKLGASHAFATVAGQSASGGLVALIGAAWTVGLDALSYLLSALSLSRIKAKEAVPRPRPEATRYWPEIAAGVRYALGDRLMRPLILASALVSAGIGASWSLWVVYVVRELHWPSLVVGLSQGIAGIGAILGGLATGSLVRRLGLPILVVIVSPIYVFDLLPTLLVGPGPTGQIMVTAGYFIVLAGEMMFAGAIRSFRQLICPPHMLGRMNATARWLSFGPKPIFTVIFGVIATRFGVWTGLAIATALFALPFILLIASPIRSLSEVPVHPDHGATGDPDRGTG